MDSTLFMRGGAEGNCHKRSGRNRMIGIRLLDAYGNRYNQFQKENCSTVQ
jgi:hypothetical protein